MLQVCGSEGQRPITYPLKTSLSALLALAAEKAKIKYMLNGAINQAHAFITALKEKCQHTWRAIIWHTFR